MEYSRKEVEQVLREMRAQGRATYSETDLAELVNGTEITPAAIRARIQERSERRRRRYDAWRRSTLRTVGIAILLGIVVFAMLGIEALAVRQDMLSAINDREHVVIERLHVAHARHVLATDPQNRAALRELADGLDRADAWSAAYHGNAVEWNRRSWLGRAATRVFHLSTEWLPEEL